MTTQEAEIAKFIKRAGFPYGWVNLESQARNMAEQAVEELGIANEKLRKAIEWRDYYRAKWLGDRAVPPLEAPCEPEQHT